MHDRKKEEKHLYQNVLQINMRLCVILVDENLSTHISTCTHTLDDAGAWWVVDIGSTHRINSVVITNRGHCCGKVLVYIDQTWR